MEIEIKEGYDYKNELKELFSEYANLVIEHDNTFKKYLEQQHFSQEIEHLSTKYGKPFGRLYIAFYKGEVAGCIALKQIDKQKCEMKRLFVKPKFRGKHIGNMLVNKIIDDAREIGYKVMLLDTFHFLQSAIKIYKKIGFYEIEQYNDSPMQDAVYLQLDL